MNSNRRLFNGVIRTLSMVLDFDEGKKLYHAWRTAVLAHRLAQRLGLEEPGLLFHAGLLHDLGAVGFPDHIVHTVQKGTSNKQLLQHAELGARIIQPFAVFQRLVPAIHDHHERFDGRGFPRGLGGDKIPLEALILSAADTLELGMRNVGREMRYTVARSLAVRESGKAWPPEVSVAIVDVIDQDPSLLVRLFQDEELEALVRELEYAPAAVDRMDPVNLLAKLLWVFGLVIDAKHPTMLGHSLRVTYFGYQIARAIGGDETNLWDVLCAGLLHDVGKIGVPRRLFGKPDASPSELLVVRKHAEDTIRVIESIEGIAPLGYPAAAHHEWYDGSGYPRGNAGEAIPLLGRVLAFADAYDGLTNPNRQGVSHEAAMSQLRARVGTQFDPHLAESALEALDIAGRALASDPTLLKRFTHMFDDDTADVRTMLTDTDERLSVTQSLSTGVLMVEVEPWTALRTDDRFGLARPEPALAELTGMTGKSLLDFLDDAGRSELARRGATLQPGSPLSQYFFTPDGRPLEFLVLRRAEGFEVYLRSAANRFQTMKRMAQFYRNFLSSAEATFFTDASGLIVDVNQSFLDLYGYTLRDVVGRSPGILEADDTDVEQLCGLLARTWAGGSWSGEIVTRARSGEEVPVHLTISSVRDAAGAHIGHIGRAVDISVRRRLELELARKNAELERLSGLKSELMAITSHDLKSPIAALISYANLLQDSLDELSADEVRRYLSEMIASGHRSLSLIDNLLDLERIDAGTFGVLKQPTRLDRALRAALEMHEPSAHAKGVELRVHFLGCVSRHVADARRMEQVFANLVGNAIKFSSRDGKVDIVYEESAEAVRVEVMDRGPGIPDGALRFIFDRYYQASSGSGEHKLGLGMGLAIARGVMTEHGGQICAENRKDGGARFVACLPASSRLDDVRALVVAPPRVAREIAADLEEAGVAATEASTATDVEWRLGRAISPDLVFVHDAVEGSVQRAVDKVLASLRPAPLRVSVGPEPSNDTPFSLHPPVGRSVSMPLLDVELAQLVREAKNARVVRPSADGEGESIEPGCCTQRTLPPELPL